MRRDSGCCGRGVLRLDLFWPVYFSTRGLQQTVTNGKSQALISKIAAEDHLHVCLFQRTQASKQSGCYLCRIGGVAECLNERAALSECRNIFISNQHTGTLPLCASPLHFCQHGGTHDFFGAIEKYQRNGRSIMCEQLTRRFLCQEILVCTWRSTLDRGLHIRQYAAQPLQADSPRSQDRSHAAPHVEHGT